ncbi:potassium channel family protein [Nitrosomonas sp. ANs5]|uniref:potassium channel family protein n=1 Tax=Nitrosomonas sp. ANs5 TaxID=3423941 RepID=UPI003D335140
MKLVFIGASATSVMAVRQLIHRGYDVVIIEKNKDRIDELADQLDCGFILGDGTRPDILREVDAKTTRLVYCMTANDQANILASLVAHSLGFPRVITKLEDPEFEHVAIELGLDNIIVPARTIGSFLADIAEGQNLLELSSIIKGEARVLSFVINESLAGPVSALALPDNARLMCIYRNGDFILPDAETKLRNDDEVVLITHSKQIPALRKRFIDTLKIRQAGPLSS